MTEDMIIPYKDQCVVMQSSMTYNIYDIILDENIREPAYYREAFQVFRQARQGDRINLIINNGGGRLDTAICFVNCIKETDAEVLAVLEGETHSAASIISLNAHGVHVKPYASMMIHHASFGSGGTVQNVMDHVNFTSKQTEKLMRDTYKHFLTPTEIDEIIRNREIWLTDEEIGERLDRMYQMRAEEEEGCDDPECMCNADSDQGTSLESIISITVDKKLDEDKFKDRFREIVQETLEKSKKSSKKAVDNKKPEA